MITFNQEVKLIIADVDDTIAPPYVKASTQMISELDTLLAENRSIYFISGGGLQSIMERVTDLINPKLRYRLLVAHCSGAEVWGFERDGNLRDRPFYSLDNEKLTELQKITWRSIVEQMEEEFELDVYPTQSTDEFIKQSQGNRRAIMKADRGPQITWECVNDPDLREVLIPRANELIAQQNLPLEVRRGGIFALDFVLEGVSKDSAIRYLFEHKEVFKLMGIDPQELNPMEDTIETWGDRYMEGRGTDHHMSLALPRNVRSVDFRKDEDPGHFPQGFNIVLWDGEGTLSEGLYAYLIARKQTSSPQRVLSTL